jgi:hypothetical protein
LNMPLPQENLGPVYDKALEGLGPWMPIELVKRCKKCGEVKALGAFYIHNDRCKLCRIKQQKEYRQTPGIKSKIRVWHQKHGQKPGVKVKQREAERRFSQKPSTKAQRTKQIRIRRSENLNFKLSDSLRCRMGYALKAGGKDTPKVGSAVRDMGCDQIKLVSHLEKQFSFRMTRNNHRIGPGKWQIDHIVPLSAYDLTNRKELLKAVHYTNLQPLWWEDNLRKSDTIPLLVPYYGSLIWTKFPSLYPKDKLPVSCLRF